MAPLQELFETHAIVKILDFLTLYKDFEYTRTDIAKEIGISRRTLYEVFPTLEKYDLVTITRSLGNVKLYKLNTENPIAKRLVTLADTIALYKAQKSTGVDLDLTSDITVEVENPYQPQESSGKVSLTYCRIEGSTASEIKELLRGNIDLSNNMLIKTSHTATTAVPTTEPEKHCIEITE